MKPNIHYKQNVSIRQDVQYHLKDLIKKHKLKRILEVGGGANPLFPFEFINKNRIEYTILDISSDELAKAPNVFLKVQADITADKLDLPGGYDLIFSRMLAEHVQNGEIFHRNVFKLLVENGRAFHCFPTLYAPPFLVNYLLPEILSDKLLQLVQSGREKEGKLGKFPAYYSWCRGPIPSQITRFECLGYHVEEYIGFFGHEHYYAKLPPMRKLHLVFVKWLLKHPIPLLTSHAYVTLIKSI
jgi:hypothetical protein